MDELIERKGLSKTQAKIAYNQMLQKQMEHYHPGKSSDLKRDAQTAVEEVSLDTRKG